MKRGDYKLLEFFPPKSGKRLTMKKLKTLLLNVRPGYLASAWLEGATRRTLRVRLNHPDGGTVCLGLKLPTEAMARLTDKVLVLNRAEWNEERVQHQRQRGRVRNAVHVKLVEERERLVEESYRPR
jgi:hypothetical protein